MREQEVDEIKGMETRSESAEQREPTKRAPHRRVIDTLTDENPLICRGMD